MHENHDSYRRVGIFRGTFDPIHNGHIAFAKRAILVANLDCVYFLPEKNISHKTQRSSYSQRIKLIAMVTDKCHDISLLRLENMNGSIEGVLPTLRLVFGKAKLIFLMGSDIAKSLPDWNDLSVLLTNNELFIGLREGDNGKEIEAIIKSLSYKPEAYKIIDAPRPALSSTYIRNKFNQSPNLN
jgi:nicotinate-nucleotide adenylyltransferase